MYVINNAQIGKYACKIKQKLLLFIKKRGYRSFFELNTTFFYKYFLF